VRLSLAFFLIVFAVFAQNPTTQLNGTVVDPQGAAVVGAEVSVVDTATNAKYPVATN